MVMKFCGNADVRLRFFKLVLGRDSEDDIISRFV